MANQTFILKGERFESDLGDADAAKLLAGSSNEFGKSLAEFFAEHGRFTERQRPWAHKLAMEVKCGAPFPGSQCIDLGAEFSVIVSLFRTAGKRGLRYPKIRFDSSDPPVCLTLASAKGRFPGSINVASGPIGRDSQWYGRVHKDGRFEPARDCPDAVVDFLKRFASNPAEFAASYGRTTGNCCFCHRSLTENRSTSVGYGPVCADKYGLPWGGQGGNTRATRAEAAT